LAITVAVAARGTDVAGKRVLACEHEPGGVAATTGLRGRPREDVIMADIVLINPRFEVSMYGLEHAMPILGVSAISVPAALPLLAALTPAHHCVTVIDENIEPIDYERCARADIVGITGMIVQRVRMMDIVAELKRRGAFVVIGGAWVTVEPGYFGALADAVFIGEAEDTWPRFLTEWAEGRHQPRYQQDRNTDVTTLPVPRYDLTDLKRYAFGNVQFSRGCPFQCEFCDIIVVFGRRPRVKTVAQVLAELQALHEQGVENVFVVDDNLIGNKKAIKAVLREVSAWQERYCYPLTLVCEASLDLADDTEMLQLMAAANIVTVFVGIESPNEDSLRETRKLQNLRKGRSMLEKVHDVQRAGIEVWSGMILGFDHDDAGIFEAHRRFITAARIVNPLISMLMAIPETPLYARLKRDGRLDFDAQFDTNIIPLRMSGEALREGANALARELYEAASYFGRLDALYLEAGFQPERERRRNLSGLRRLKADVLCLIQAAAILLGLMIKQKQAELRREYRHRMWRALKQRRDPYVLRNYAVKCAIHYHMNLMSQPGRPLINFGYRRSAAEPRSTSQLAT
jgi:radical SAM superfamily enzyme YgiQ (UPF0313 family)